MQISANDNSIKAQFCWQTRIRSCRDFHTFCYTDGLFKKSMLVNLFFHDFRSSFLRESSFPRRIPGSEQTKIHNEHQFSTCNLHSQIHYLNFHRKKKCMLVKFLAMENTFYAIIHFSARILVSAMNSRLCLVQWLGLNQ